jgi:nucleoid-associated protein YgaU
MGIFGKKDQRQPDFSNLRGGSSTTAPASSTAVATTERTYTVVEGDTLSGIAKRLYGEANKWKRIYDANRDVIDDPDLIYPGQDLKIPE